MELASDCRRLPNRDGRWVPAFDEDSRRWLWVQLPPGWYAVPGWPGWGKLLPGGFTGITDPFKRWLWRRGGTAWGFRAVLHEIGHALQVDRLGRVIFALHAGRYILRFGYRRSRIERGADAAMDRALAWWAANGKPDFIPQEAFA